MVGGGRGDWLHREGILKYYGVASSSSEKGSYNFVKRTELDGIVLVSGTGSFRLNSQMDGGWMDGGWMYAGVLT